MIRWRSTAMAFGADPELAALLMSRQPAIVFARDGRRVLFANSAGGRALGARNFATLAARDLEGAPLARALANLARTLPPEGSLARLRLSESLPALPVLCRCRAVRAGEARGILVIVLQAGVARPALDDLAAFFGGEGRAAAIVDARGHALSESDPGAADAATAAVPSVEFDHEGEPLRLYVMERDSAPPRPAPAAARPSLDAPSIALDGPGLSAIAARAYMPAPARPEPAQAKTPEPPATPPPVDASAGSRHRTPEPERPPETTQAPVPESPPPREEEPRAEPVSSKSVAPPAAPSHPRTVVAGRVEQDLSRKSVRFLWQTDSADRFLFVSPGLSQVVGRNAEIVGERWEEVAERLHLDPGGRIDLALKVRDTWSGLTAWWPIEGSGVRVPVEMSALPVFGPDQSFQGYRGFAVLKPAEALMPAAFEARFGLSPGVEPQPPHADSPGGKVVPIRADLDRVSAEHERLTAQEKNAFEEIAAALRDRIVDGLAERAATQAGDKEATPPARSGEPPLEAAPPEAGLKRAEPLPAAPESLALEPPPLEPEPAAAKPAPPAAHKAEPRAPAADPRLGQLNEQLAEARRRQREMTAILDTATDGVVVLDVDGVIESVNASAEALFGLDAHEMVGRAFAELLRPESRDEALDYLSGLRDSGVASLLNEGREVEAAAGIGSIPLFMTMGRISSDEGQRFCAVLRDITHWKRIEADLTAARRAAEEASTQKSQFLARVGAEIRAPLNSIIGYAEDMVEERFGAIANERYREHLREIRAAGEHVVNLVNDLLDVSRVESGRLDLVFGAVPLNAMVREAMGLMQAQANRARVVLRSSLSREVPAIVADERTFRQVVMNLFSHAIRHAGAGGQVIISTSLSETGEALLRVRDTGRGMSEEELRRALEPFRDLSIASLIDRSGSGLGLPLTKALVEANRATLAIRSAEGEGTVLTVTIPPTRVLSE